MWTKNALQELIQTKLGDRRLILVANREPYLHRFVEGKILRAPRAAWCAWANHARMRRRLDRARQRQRGPTHGRRQGSPAGPPDDPQYTLRRVWHKERRKVTITARQRGLWPLSHGFTRPIFNPKHWPIYRQVNEIFAQAVLEETGDEPAFVFIQDYHFGLLLKILKERNHTNLIVAHWHIPWPNRKRSNVSVEKELLDSLLATTCWLPPALSLQELPRLRRSHAGSEGRL